MDSVCQSPNLGDLSTIYASFLMPYQLLVFSWSFFRFFASSLPKLPWATSNQASSRSLVKVASALTGNLKLALHLALDRGLRTYFEQKEPSKPQLTVARTCRS